jgi:hypothetical protein
VEAERRAARKMGALGEAFAAAAGLG